MNPNVAVPGYELQLEVHTAGDASLSEARELRSGRACALSLLRSTEPPTPEQEARQLRFLEEGKALLGFKHPNVVRTFDVGSSAGCAWIAQELVRGLTLQEILERRGGTLEVEHTLALGIQIGRALGSLATRDLVHRDINPAHLLVTADGTVHLTGFGLNFESSSDRLSTGQAPLGSVDFLSPEQVEGELPPTPRADVYGLGATLYRCMAGRVPHGGASMFTRLRAIAHDAPPDLRELNPDVPDSLAELLSRFMEWDADDRPLPQDTSVLLERVAVFMGHEGRDWESSSLASLVAELTAADESKSSDPGTTIVVRLRGTDRTIDRPLRVGDTFEIGRASDADVSIPVAWISRRHARISRGPDGLTLTDLGSANGTKANDAKVKGTIALQQGDLITLGKKSRFEVSLLDAGSGGVYAVRQCLLCGQDLAGEHGEEDEETGQVCVRCQARTEAERTAAESRMKQALEDARFEVTEEIDTRCSFKRYRVRRRKRTFIVSAVELGQRNAKLYAEGSKRALEVNHPVALRTVDIDPRSGFLFIVSESYEGRTVDDLVREEPLSPNEAADLGQTLCDLIHHLSEEEIGFPVIRPNLILIGNDGEPKLLDVGLTPALAQASRMRAGFGPQPCFEAPEVVEGQPLGPAAIVYSLGATLSFALTGSPVAEVRGEDRYDHLPLTMVSSVPASLAAVLSTATSPDPGDRYAGTVELGAALAAVILESASAIGRKPKLKDDDSTDGFAEPDLPK